MIDFFLVFFIGTIGVTIAVIGCVLAIVRNIRSTGEEERIQHLEKEVEALKESEQGEV
ncbi:hypothetical protein GLW00_15740 [Halobacillus litoralis]|uniref:DUF4083 domain-containing protein n=1 Tax=Halobacillus litoralis TaxID=45668 RepID=A0A845FFK3_9BACI|nr:MULTISPECIES: hypothetical protein [Halobacillus]MEC3885300.1 hypothetical protein [Halobacillus sp. HZG1]MYL72297.1 hypothetical protein [Halobacillus litoralis]